MKIRLPFLLFSAFLLIIGCQSRENDIEEQFIGEFPDPVELSGERFLEDEIGLSTINFIDRLIITSTARDTMFHVYDKDQNYIVGFGRSGSGPGEFERPPRIGDVKTDSEDIYSIVYDGSDLKAVIINLTASVAEGEIVVKEEFELPSELRHPIIDIFFADEDQYFGMYDDRFHQNLDERRGGFYFNVNQNSFETFQLFNLEIEPYDIFPEINLNVREAAVSPDRSKIAIVLRHAPILEILDVGSDTPDRYVLEEDSPLTTVSAEAFEERDLMIYYEDIYVTDDKIYLLYSGMMGYESGYVQKVRVMDWGGNPLSQYSLSGASDLDWLIVDEENEQFYVLSWTHDSIFRYDFGMN